MAATKKKRLSSYVQLRRGYEPCGNISYWEAYWRGTNNKIKQADGQDVPPHIKQSDLRFDLLNNSVEHGVIAN